MKMIFMGGESLVAMLELFDVELFQYSARPVQPDEKTHPDENYHFVDGLSDSYLCPILAVLLLEPHLTECCGQHISQIAVDQFFTRSYPRRPPCPFCSKPLVTIRDANFRRQVRELPVFCPNKNRGCEWVADLSELETHIEQCPRQFGTPANLKLKALGI